jgi:hypothetical protein
MYTHMMNTRTHTSFPYEQTTRLRVSDWNRGNSQCDVRPYGRPRSPGALSTPVVPPAAWTTTSRRRPPDYSRAHTGRTRAPLRKRRATGEAASIILASVNRLAYDGLPHRSQVGEHATRLPDDIVRNAAL